MSAQRLARIGALLADPTRAEILTALMDGRAHTGSELARHLGVAPSTASEHLSKLLDGRMVTVEAQGRHRYFRVANPETAQLLETLGVGASLPEPPKAAAGLTYARTCYDHLAGQLGVAIYDDLVANRHLVNDDHHLVISPSGFDLFELLGVDVEAIVTSLRPKARSCLDWTQRRHHLAGAAGKGLLDALVTNRWLARGHRPRSVHVTKRGHTALQRHFHLTSR